MNQAIIALGFAALFWPAFSQAALNLKSPEDLVLQARKNLNGVRTVVTDIDLNLSEIRDGRTFHKYFEILPELEVLAAKHNLDSIYPKAVRKLGARMVQKGVHWLRIDEDSAEKILLYHDWMSDSAPSFTFLYAAELTIEGIKLDSQNSRASLKSISSKLEKLIEAIDRKWSQETSLRVSYRSLISNLSVRVIKTSKDLTPQDFEFWIGRIHKSDYLNELVIGLQGKLQAIGRGETSSQNRASEAKATLQRLILISKALKTTKVSVPDSLYLVSGEAIGEALILLLKLKAELTPADFQEALSNTNNRGLPQLANLWISHWREIPSSYAIQFLDLGLILAARLLENGWYVEAQSLKDFLHVKYVPAVCLQHKLEGMWKFQDYRKKKWSLIIVRADEDQFFASLADQEGFVYRDAYYLTFDPSRKLFIAANRKTDFGRSTNLPFHFSWDSETGLSVSGIHMEQMQKEYKAVKTQNFPNFIKEEHGPVGATEGLGVYRGKLTIPGMEKTLTQLMISASNEVYFANMTQPFLNKTFNYGSQLKGNVIYLTSGSDGGRGSFFQLRGTFENGVYKAYIIRGGTGLEPKPVQFVKQGN